MDDAHKGSQEQLLCSRWAEVLMLGLVEDLAPADRETFLEHLQSCATCAAERQYSLLMEKHLSSTIKAARQPIPVPPKLSVRPPSMKERWNGWISGSLFDGPSLSIALLVGVLTFFSGQVVALVPGTNPVLVTPITMLVTAFMLLFGASMGKTLFPAWLSAEKKERNKLNGASRKQGFWGRVQELDGPLPEQALSTLVPLTPLHRDALDIASATPHLKQSKRRWTSRGIVLVAILSLCAAALSSLGVLLLNPTLSKAQPGIKISEPMPTGISIGSRVFDIRRSGVNLKLQGAEKLAAGDSLGAKMLWQRAIELDSTDAETLIYLENIRVQQSGRPFITLVVGTILAPDYISGGRDDLQGAYVAQRQFNNEAWSKDGMLLRLMVAVANANGTEAAATVAKQVVEAASKDSTIVGVMGWPTSSTALGALPILTEAGLPMVSPTASSDDLTAKSPYFFRVSPTNSQQGVFAAYYAKEILKVQRVAVFVDPNDSYSVTLARSFKESFMDGSHIVYEAPYRRGQPDTVQESMLEALSWNVNMIFFSGYASDVGTILKNLPPCAYERDECLLVMGGDALYLGSDYSLDDMANYYRLFFTAFAYPGDLQRRMHPFLSNYAATYDPDSQYRRGTYGVNWPEGHTILSYDAMSVLLHATSQLWQQGKNRITPALLRQAIAWIDKDHPMQGASGLIGFESSGNVIAGTIVLLAGDEKGDIRQAWPAMD